MSNMDIQYDGRWYSVHISHSGLHKYKVIRGRTKFEVQQMAQAQLAQWQEAWDTRTRKEWDRAQKEQDKAERELAKQRDQEILHAKKNRAAELTAAAAAEVTRLQGLLSDTLKKDDRLDWDALKDNTAFSAPKPQIPRPSPPTLPALPRRPERTDPKYQPDYGMAHS